MSNANQDVVSKCLEDLQKIRHYEGEPAQFWLTFLHALLDVCSGQAGLIASRGLQEGSLWQSLAFAPAALRTGPYLKILSSKLEEALGRCLQSGAVVVEMEEKTILAALLKTGSDQQHSLVLLCLEEQNNLELAAQVEHLKFLADIPADYQLRRSAEEARQRQEHLTAVLDLSAQVNAQQHFLAAAMTLCNELAARHQCQRVALGWESNGYVRLQALSRMDDFDKKMETVQKLEEAMEETLDQNAEIILPPLDQQETVIDRAHRAYAEQTQTPYFCSLPLRHQDQAVGVCLLERDHAPFSVNEIKLLRLCCDQTSARLMDLKKLDRGFTAHFMEQLRQKASGLLGPEHTWAKVIAVGVVLLLAVLCFVPVTYRVESPVILHTDDIAYLTAPFDGHIEQAKFRLGDDIQPGDELLVLDRNQLQLEEAGLSAEVERYGREAEKARASQALSDMRIALAMKDQSQARLELVRYRLQQAAIQAPFAGALVEGDWLERIGSPVRQGDLLFKIGRLDRMDAELEIKESEIDHILPGQKGEIALASRPEETIAIRVLRVEPAAQSKKNGNVFLARAAFEEKPPDWWRPGMTGISKLNAGQRTLLWILTHRTMDFLRLRLWW